MSEEIHPGDMVRVTPPIGRSWCGEVVAVRKNKAHVRDPNWTGGEPIEDWVLLRHCRRLTPLTPPSRLHRPGDPSQPEPAREQPKGGLVHDRAYMQWVKAQGCQVPECDAPADDPHHVTRRKTGGGHRDDHAVVGLCRAHHDEVERTPDRIGQRTKNETLAMLWRQAAMLLGRRLRMEREKRGAA